MNSLANSLRSIFGYPIYQISLDHDLEKLIEFAREVREKNPEGGKYTNQGGWHSNPIELAGGEGNSNEEFVSLKASIQQQVKIYHKEFFKTTEFHANYEPLISDVWLNINGKNHWNDWHIHPEGIFSGTFYIQHDSDKNGDIVFKNPLESKLEYLKLTHCLDRRLVKKYDDLLSKEIRITPEPNMLLMFPSWLHHKVTENLGNNERISLSFDTILL
jgi:uncharacterized protein (TIGR02466 family)